MCLKALSPLSFYPPKEKPERIRSFGKEGNKKNHHPDGLKIRSFAQGTGTLWTGALAPFHFLSCVRANKAHFIVF